MKRYLTLYLVMLLSACANLGDKGSAAERAELARQEAARQEATRLQEEARKQEEARREELRRQEEARQEELRKQEEARRQEELQRWEELRKQEEARLEEQRRQEELRKQEELAQMEELRRQRMEDDDDPSLVGMVTEEQLKKANPLLVERSVYYDYDKYEIKPKYVPIVTAHARFLIAHPTVKIFVEGNCDDRGSPEYNIALGQRRAESIQRALLALGVPGKQVEAVSYGAERPVAYGQNEESWAQNRRVDIAYPILKR